MTTTSDRPSTAIHANCCDSWWTGMNACHCGGCHETFTSPSTFDKHRRVGKCLTPQEIALVPADRVWSGWQQPGSNPQFDSDVA